MVVVVASKWIFENIFVITYLVPKKQLRVPSATRPPSAPRPCHARPTHQPSESPAKELPLMPDSASGGRGEAPSRGRVVCSPGWWRLVKQWKSQHDTGDKLGTYQRMCCFTYCCIAIARRGWVGWCVRVGRSVGVWVDGRAGSWLWVVDVFCSFVFWTHGAFTTRRWSAA